MVTSQLEEQLGTLVVLKEGDHVKCAACGENVIGQAYQEGPLHYHNQQEAKTFQREVLGDF